MTQQIKNFIEEGEKSFDKKWVKLFEEGSWPMIGIELKQFISSRQISLIKMIVDMVESEKKCNKTAYIKYTEPTEWDFTEEDKKINQALDTISSKLLELTDGK